MLVHVVMGNDFPDSVWSSLEKAEAHCAKKRKEGPFNPSGSSRIHWRVYDFNLDNEAHYAAVELQANLLAIEHVLNVGLVLPKEMEEAVKSCHDKLKKQMEGYLK